MFNRNLKLATSTAAVALLAACSATPINNSGTMGSPSSAPVPVNSASMMYGNVSNIEVVPVASRSSAGGAVLGAVIGAVVGNQVGSGSGRTAATAAGAIGGAVVGNEIAKRRSDNEVYRITVRLDSGSVAQYDYEQIGDLRIGDRVRVDGGQLARV